MVQNQPMWVTYSGRRAKRKSPIGQLSSGVQRRLGFLGGDGAVKGQKLPILGLKPVSRRDVRVHVAT